MTSIHEEIKAQLTNGDPDFTPCESFPYGFAMFIGKTSKHYIGVRGASIVPHAIILGSGLYKAYNDKNKVTAVPEDYEPPFKEKEK